MKKEGFSFAPVSRVFSASSRPSRIDAYRFLMPVREERNFCVATGQEISTLEELFATLTELDDNTFRHHVNADRNDFAKWVRHCLKDMHLAEQIENLRDKDHMALHIGRRLHTLLEVKQK